MTISSLAALAILLQQPNRPLSAQEYAVDAGHSIVEFSIGFALIRIKGRFAKWQGTIFYDSTNPGTSSVTAIFESKSITTGSPHRDKHLRTPDFFDVERFPTITFQSEDVRRNADGGWTAAGPFTMHGVTKRVVLPFRLLPGSPSRDPDSRNMMLHLLGELRLARKDFGILGGNQYEPWLIAARNATIADSVSINLEIEAWRSDAATQRPASVQAALDRVTASGIGAQLDVMRVRLDTTPAANRERYLVGQEYLVRSLIWTGQTRDALTLARAMTEWFPAAPVAELSLSFASAAAGDAATADAAATRAQEKFSRLPPYITDPETPVWDPRWYFMDELTRTGLEVGYTAAALRLARAVAQMFPTNPRAHARLGQLLAAAGKRAEAEQSFAKAIEVDPMEPRAFEYRRRAR
jgi:polyisoprenoid-binding protein YceI